MSSAPVSKRRRMAVAFAAAGLVTAGAAAYGVAGMLLALDDAADALHDETKAQTVTVVAASRTLYQGVEISTDDLFTVEVPVDTLPIVRDADTGTIVKAPVFSSRVHVVGQVPRERILPNEFIRPERLADGSAGVGLNAVIPRGMRAISLGVAGTDAVSGFLSPGDYVDVLVTMADEFGESRTETILQAVFLLGVNSRARLDADEDVAQRGAQSPSVTFLATPKQAEDLAYAGEVGALSLTLRNPRDIDFVGLKGIDLDALLERVGAVRPLVQEATPVRWSAGDAPRTPSGPSTFDIDLYKGPRKTVVTFETPADADTDE